jgi:polyferredoxin
VPCRRGGPYTTHCCPVLILTKILKKRRHKRKMRKEKKNRTRKEKINDEEES